jgi:hypothetical protein
MLKIDLIVKSNMNSRTVGIGHRYKLDGSRDVDRSLFIQLYVQC